MYINEIIRVTYKCNWKCKFCNVLKTNNYWEIDIISKQVVYEILELARKYKRIELNSLDLSFSWWEPTLSKNLWSYIKLAKSIWVWNVQIQTNWTIIFSDLKLLDSLVNSWLNEIFLANHSENSDINMKMWSYSNIDNFLKFLEYFKNNKLNSKIKILTNIVVNKINLPTTINYINFLLENDYFEIIWNKHLSIWFVQANWYANINKDEVLLKYSPRDIKQIVEIIKHCEKKWLLLDFHYTSPPLCILNYPEYNLEYYRLKQLENDKKSSSINDSNLESFKYLWKEKQKFEECNKCKYNDYCLWFYKNWVSFVWDDYAKEKINNFLKNGK